MKGDIKSNVSYQHSFITFFFLLTSPWRTVTWTQEPLHQHQLSCSSVVIWTPSNLDLDYFQLMADSVSDYVELNINCLWFASCSDNPSSYKQPICLSVICFFSQHFQLFIQYFKCTVYIFYPFFLFYPDIETVNPSSPLFQLLIIFISSGFSFSQLLLSIVFSYLYI